MTNQVITEQNRVTVGYTLKVPIEGVKYGSEEVTVFLPRTVENNATDEGITALAHEALAEARKVAAEHLNIEVGITFTDEGVEKAVLDFKKAFPGTVDEPKPRSGGSGSPQQRPTSNSGGGRDQVQVGPVTILRPINDDDLTWVAERWQEAVDEGKIDADDTELWDNRKFLPAFGGNGSPRGPHFKTSKGKKGVWPS